MQSRRHLLRPSEGGLRSRRDLGNTTEAPFSHIIQEFLKKTSAIRLWSTELSSGNNRVDSASLSNSSHGWSSFSVEDKIRGTYYAWWQLSVPVLTKIMQRQLIVWRWRAERFGDENGATHATLLGDCDGELSAFLLRTRNDVPMLHAHSGFPWWVGTIVELA